MCSNSELRLMLATKDDFDFFLFIKSEKFNVDWTGGSSRPIEENLKKFFYNTVEVANERLTRKIYIIKKGEKSIGYLYIIPKTEEVYEQSVAISESECGKHYGSGAIALGLKEAGRLGFIRMEGSIREDNSASLNAHRKCGITITDDYEYMWIPSENKNIKMLKMYYDII